MYIYFSYYGSVRGLVLVTLVSIVCVVGESEFDRVHLVLKGGCRDISGHLLVLIIRIKIVVRLCGVGWWIRFSGCSGHPLVISVVNVAEN